MVVGLLLMQNEDEHAATFNKEGESLHPDYRVFLFQLTNKVPGRRQLFGCIPLDDHDNCQHAQN